MEQGRSNKDKKGKKQSRPTLERSNTDALFEVGLNHSSEETSVMGEERRVEIIQASEGLPTRKRKNNSSKARGIPITMEMVKVSYQKVKSKKGSGGIDGVSLAKFAEQEEGNLYKIWNRMSSGSYFPRGLRQVKIPKGNGKERLLGIPTITDRIAQQVIKDYLEPRLEKVFVKYSYGYRPLKSAHQALQNVRDYVQKQDWVIDIDIKQFFDEMSHEKVLKALSRHVEENWVMMYIKRWLEAPMIGESGVEEHKQGKGTPQGGVISPLLANLYLHYAFDKWMMLNHPKVKFVRYADDIVVVCERKEEAEQLKKTISERMQACDLEIHEGKSKIVFCKKYKKQSKHKVVQFDFLGYSFQPRTSSTKNGIMFLGYDCAISQKSKNKIIKQIREYNFQRWTNRSIEQIAMFWEKQMIGWINYYGKFRKYKLFSLFRIFEARVINWARKRYKRFNGSFTKACQWFWRLRDKRPSLFAHWRLGFIGA